MRQRRGRGHADRGDLLAVRRTTSWNECDRARAAPARRRSVLSSAQQLGRIGQPLGARIRAQGMMNQQHAKGLFGGELRKDTFECLELRAAEPSASPSAAASAPPRKRRSAPAGRAGAATEKPRRVRCRVAAQIVAAGFGKAVLCGADIGVVIARDHGDCRGSANALQPGPRRRELRFEREIDEIAGDRDVVRPLAPAGPTPAYRPRRADGICGGCGSS